LTVGSQYATIATLSAEGTLDIRPASGIEAIIHNIYYANSIDIYFANDTLSIKIASRPDNGDLQGYWHVSNNYFLRIIDTSGVGNTVGVDGIVSTG